jgi:ubiquitin-protein ligase
MSDDENYDGEMEEENNAAYDSDYCYESEGGDNFGDEGPARAQTTQRTGEAKVVNNFHVLMDSKSQTTEEWRAIYAQLRNLVLKSDRTINYEWNHTHETEFRTAILYIQSLKVRSSFYPIRINFHATKELCFPELAPQIQPLFTLPAPYFVMISKHPLLTPKNWNPCQDLSLILEPVLSLLDSQIPNIENALLAAPIGGGSLTAFIRSAEEANKWLATPAVSNLTMEQLTALLYGYYMFEIPYHPMLLQQFISGENILNACPVSKLQKDALPKNSGVGFSRDLNLYHYTVKGREDTSNTAQQQQSAADKIMMILKEKLDCFLTIMNGYKTNNNNNNNPGKKAGQSKSNDHSLALDFETVFTEKTKNTFIDWLYESPLLYILHLNIQQMASGDIVRESGSTFVNFDLLVLLEEIYHARSSSSSSSQQIMEENVQFLFEECYKKLYSWYRMDLFSEGTIAEWFKNITKNSDYWKNMLQPEEGKVERKKNQPQGSSFLSFLSSGTTTSSNVENPQKMMKTDKTQVVYCSGVENTHFYYLYSSGYPREKCPKFFLKELKTMNESLPEEITLFVSEEHPNYLIAVFSIKNVDCPYYGGIFIFHVMIPEQYPEVSPKVHFI